MVPPRLALDGGLTRPQGSRGGGELPVEGTDTELRSRRSVTDTESSAGLKNQEVKNKPTEPGVWHLSGPSIQTTRRRMNICICTHSSPFMCSPLGDT